MSILSLMTDSSKSVSGRFSHLNFHLLTFLPSTSTYSQTVINNNNNNDEDQHVFDILSRFMFVE